MSNLERGDVELPIMLIRVEIAERHNLEVTKIIFPPLASSHHPALTRGHQLHSIRPGSSNDALDLHDYLSTARKRHGTVIPSFTRLSMLKQKMVDHQMSCVATRRDAEPCGYNSFFWGFLISNPHGQIPCRSDHEFTIILF